MAARQGNTVWNNRGSSAEFTNETDAGKAYALMCDYEAFLSDLIDAGRISVHGSGPVETKTEKY